MLYYDSFSFTYHISFSDVFPELISDLFVLLNPNFNSNFDLCMILKQDIYQFSYLPFSAKRKE